MASSSLIRKFRNLINQPPFLIFMDLLSIIPGRPFQLSKFFVLELSEPSVTTINGIGAVRKGTMNDVSEMCTLENKRDVFINRFHAGEFCAVAVYDNEIIGYEWFSDKAMHLEDRLKYRLQIPEDSIYAYDAFIRPKNRRGGTWSLITEYMRDQARGLGRRNIISMVDYGNDRSLKAHLHFGYVIIREVLCVRLFSKVYFRENNYSPGSFNPVKAMAQ